MINLNWPKIIPHTEEVEEAECIEINFEATTIEALLHEIEFDFPHITKKLSLLVGHKEFELEMQNLLIDTRGKRQGFPKKTLEDLVKLSNAHAIKYGKFISNTGNYYVDQYRNKKDK